MTDRHKAVGRVNQLSGRVFNWHRSLSVIIYSNVVNSRLHSRLRAVCRCCGEHSSIQFKLFAQKCVLVVGNWHSGLVASNWYLRHAKDFYRLLPIIRNFQVLRQMLFFHQSSKPNEPIFNTMFYDSVCLQGPHGYDPSPSFRRLWILWRHEYDVIKSRDVIDDIIKQRTVGTIWVPVGHQPLDRLVSEIFSIKVADGQLDTSTDNKGRLNLAAREPIMDITYQWLASAAVVKRYYTGHCRRGWSAHWLSIIAAQRDPGHREPADVHCACADWQTHCHTARLFTHTTLSPHRRLLYLARATYIGLQRRIVCDVMADPWCSRVRWHTGALLKTLAQFMAETLIFVRRALRS